MTYSVERPKFIEAEWVIKHPVVKAVQLLPGEANAQAFVRHVSSLLGVEVVDFNFRLTARMNKNHEQVFSKSKVSVTFSNGDGFDIEDGQWLVFKGDGTTQVIPHATLSYDYDKKVEI